MLIMAFVAMLGEDGILKLSSLLVVVVAVVMATVGAAIAKETGSGVLA